ncbi:hypothetical protein FSP39_004270 [Pinctada imbricata]|uniref:Uncharacterized protein n=1 Tax=Pinctada imbricata TaxID=66713 RepID=A0AA88Y2B5_PINIB|nr:hypothetical protein FSP39_004270 [Pinctada imbricata]
MHRPEYGTSAGTNLFLRGPYNSTPLHNYLSGDGKSHVFRGPGYYVPSENRWMHYHEYRSLPRETRRDAILFESEDDWVKFQRKRDAQTNPGGISMSGKPTLFTGVPEDTLLPANTHAWNKPWTGAGLFQPSGNKWFRDQDSPAMPKDALMFHNEEDWIKFKYMTENPSLYK